VVDKKGYKLLHLSSGMVYEHQAVYRSHYPGYDKRYHIHHIDHDKLNNDISNLIALPRMLHWHVHHEAKRINRHLTRQEIVDKWLNGTSHYGSMRTEQETIERNELRIFKKRRNRLKMHFNQMKSYYTYFVF